MFPVDNSPSNSNPGSNERAPSPLVFKQSSKGGAFRPRALSAGSTRQQRETQSRSNSAAKDWEFIANPEFVAWLKVHIDLQR